MERAQLPVFMALDLLLFYYANPTPGSSCKRLGLRARRNVCVSARHQAHCAGIVFSRR